MSERIHCDCCGDEIEPGEQIALRVGAEPVRRLWPPMWRAGRPVAGAITAVDLCAACWSGLKYVVETVRRAESMRPAGPQKKEGSYAE